MLKFRWIHHTKAVLIASTLFAAMGALGGLVWLNQRGFEGEWGRRIAEELAHRGIQAEFEMVRFSPLRGIIAREVVIYTDATRQEIFAEIPRLRFEVDRGKALRGELQIRRVILHDAHLALPVSSDGSRKLHFRNLSGRASLDRQNRFVLEDARGSLGGMNFTLDVELDEFEFTNISPDREGEGARKRDEFVASALAELAQWSFPPSRPAEVHLRIAGSVQRPSSVRTAFAIDAAELTRRDYTMQDVHFTGELHGQTLTIDGLRFAEGLGELTTTATYNLNDKSGHYQLNSSIKIADLLRRALDNHTLDDLVSAHAPQVAAHGEFALRDDGLSLSVIGNLALNRFRFLGNPFEHLQTQFSWRDGKLFLRDLTVTHESGKLTGRILLRDEVIQYEAKSSLPLSAFRPFLKEDSGLDRALARTTFHADGRALLDVNGTIKRDNLRDWRARGTALFEGFSYQDVPLARASAGFDITPDDAVYRDVEAEFEYSNYIMRRRHGGPRRAVVHASEVHFDRSTMLTHVGQLRGTAWPGPLLALFVPHSARYVEQNYGFRSPPEFNASGVIDNRKPGTRTDVTSRVRANGVTDYRFLDRTLQLTRLAATVRDRYRRHDVTNLQFFTLGGWGGGDVVVRERAGRAATFSGGIKWTETSLAELGRKYGFSNDAHGHITGRIDFSGTMGETRTLNGRGVIGLRNGQLFHVPVFGPLSAPIGSVLGNKKFSHEQARDASATFVIKDGVAYTNDFLTSTPSSVFTGEGRVDLATKRLDMTVRMNARGLLGLVTLPLRPFTGLFQFRGQGPLKNPVWRSSSFTQPPRGRNDPVFRAPPRAQIVPE